MASSWSRFDLFDYDVSVQQLEMDMWIQKCSGCSFTDVKVQQSSFKLPPGFDVTASIISEKAKEHRCSTFLYVNDEINRKIKTDSSSECKSEKVYDFKMLNYDLQKQFFLESSPVLQKRLYDASKMTARLASRKPKVYVANSLDIYSPMSDDSRQTMPSFPLSNAMIVVRGSVTGEHLRDFDLTQLQSHIDFRHWYVWLFDVILAPEQLPVIFTPFVREVHLTFFNNDFCFEKLLECLPNLERLVYQCRTLPEGWGKMLLNRRQNRPMKMLRMTILNDEGEDVFKDLDSVRQFILRQHRSFNMWIWIKTTKAIQGLDRFFSNVDPNFRGRRMVVRMHGDVYLAPKVQI